MIPLPIPGRLGTYDVMVARLRANDERTDSDLAEAFGAGSCGIVLRRGAGGPAW